MTSPNGGSVNLTMIQTIYTCDRCGRVIDYQERVIVCVAWGEPSVRSLDVCTDCKQSFARWLRQDMQT